MSNRKQQIIRASWVSIIGNAVLSVLKISVGLIAGSLAVVGDGIDSASDIVASVITLVTAYIISKPPNPKYPYGYEKADTLASKVLAFIIFFAGAQLAISTTTRLVQHSATEIPETFAIYVIILSVIGKTLLALYLRKTGKKTDSSMLIANARNMQNDVLISGTVLTGLIFTFWLKIPVIDTITALAVSFWIMYSAFKIFMQTNIELMDGIENPEIYNEIFESVAKIPGIHHPHNCKVRRMGHQYMIALDLEVDGAISVTEAHKMAHQVERQVKADIRNVYDILVHVEPIDSDIKDTSYGVSGEDL